VLEKLRSWINGKNKQQAVLILRTVLLFVKERKIPFLWYSRTFNRFKELFLPFIEAPYCVISSKPIIVITIWDFWNYFRLFSKIPKRGNVYFIFLCWSLMESDGIVEQIKNEYNKHSKKYPKHKLIYLCNSLKQFKIFGKFDLPRIFCNQNAFLDKRMYKIIPNVGKKYDGIYNARIVTFKRHFLASKVKNLALIAFTGGSTQTDIDSIKKALPEATWINKATIRSDEIPEEEICKYLNQAKVGLCLSAREGAMYASAEYLLCGLPVVSTRSNGGRDVFFDKEYVKIVDDLPEAVSEGVEEMVKRDISPYYIREKTLEKMKAHRERFISLVQSIYNNEGVYRDFRGEWDKVFINKMLCWKPIRFLKKI